MRYTIVDAAADIVRWLVGTACGTVAYASAYALVAPALGLPAYTLGFTWIIGSYAALVALGCVVRRWSMWRMSYAWLLPLPLIVATLLISGGLMAALVPDL